MLGYTFVFNLISYDEASFKLFNNFMLLLNNVFYLTVLYVFENLVLANKSVSLLLSLICHIFSLFELYHCPNYFHLFLTCNWVLCFEKNITK
jgi:hypothetical protein